MFLKALTLKGFKSFAENTQLTFEPGVTVIVGPNGSGKSNLVDAVAWVLGAQGARALRGAKMDDVIFAGTTKKPALGRAEVSLVIDNSDGSLPIDFSEVSITRTLFRSGESEYRLNDVPCRLLDIQELLSDSRIGRTQHVIVGQGQLDSVLNARPEDRRAIIEEAAGVLKYRKRREKAQRRLEATEGNLVRLNDLVREVRRQLTPLQRQADDARRHDGVRDELYAIRLFLTGKEIQGYQATLERIQSERIDFSDNEKAIIAELADLDSSVLEAEAALMRVGDSNVSSWLTRAERLLAKTSATISMLSERKRSINAQLDASADESVVESLIFEKSQLNNAIAELENSLSVLTPTLSSVRNEYEQFIQHYDQLVATEPSDDVIREYDTVVKENKLHNDNLSVFNSRLENDTARLSSIRNRITVLTQDNNDAHDVLSVETESLKHLKHDYAMNQQNLDAIRHDIESARNDHSYAQSNAAKAQAQHEVILESFNTQTTIHLDKIRDRPGVLGALVENITIDAEALDAVSVVLEDLASAIVVESRENAQSIFETLSEKELSARLLILDASRGSSESVVYPPGVKALIDFVHTNDSRIKHILDLVFARTAFIDSDWRTACNLSLAHPEITVVTRSGDIFSARGTWSLGKAAKRTITRESLNEAKREEDEAQQRLLQAQARLEQLINQRDIYENSDREMLSRINDIQSRISIAQQTERATRSGIDARNNEANALNKEISELQEMISSEEHTVQELSNRTELLREQRDTIEIRRREYSEHLREKESARFSLENEIRRLEIEHERTQTRLNDSRQRLDAVEQRLAKDPEQEVRARKRREQQLNVIATIDQLIERTRSVEETSLYARDILSQERQRQTEKAHESSSQLEHLRIQRREAEKKLVDVRASLQKGEITEAETKTKLTTALEALRSTFDCEPEVAINSAIPDIPEGTTLTSRARDLERDLKLMGPINPLAVQEYDELNERHVFLSQQLDDVKASRKELHKVIKNIDIEIVAVFEKAFEDVQHHFSELFSTLFSGGSGRLTLTDPSDMLNTGIDMEARPSGKNVRRLSLLSGGERSLTALAFLFAVFRSRPSPFYIMDEVEAALDEPNLMRFLDLTAEFRHDAQLLIVSHQKKTMEAADELYGVTMAPGGSSRAIKQRIEQTKEHPNIQKSSDVVDLVAIENEESLDTTSSEEYMLESSI